MPIRRFVLTVPIGPTFDPRAEETFRSVLSARGQDTDVTVALCDCSDDARAHRLGETFRDIIGYERHGPDSGQAAAIAEGWDALKGDLVGWLNADDELTPNALETVRSIFDQNPHIDVVYGQSQIISDRNSDASPVLHPAVEPPSPLLFRSNIISQPSCFVRRTALEKAGGIDTSLHYTMDWDLWVRLMENGAVFHYTDEILSSVYWGSGTKTGEFNRQRIGELWRVVRRNCSLLTGTKTIFAFWQHHRSTYKS